MKYQLVIALVAMQMLAGSILAGESADPRMLANVAYDAGVKAELAGDRQPAEKLYRRAISLAPGESTFYVALGKLYEGENKLAAAEATYKQAMKFSGNDDGMLQPARANLLWAQGKTAESVRVWRNASQTNGGGGRQPACANDIAFAPRHQE